MAVDVRRATNKIEEDESVFISMTDIMISLLFVVIILMAFFALQMRSDEPTILRSIHDVEVFNRDKTIDEQKLVITSRDATIRMRDEKILDLNKVIDDLKATNVRLRVDNDKLTEANQRLLLIVAKLRKERQKTLDKFLAGISKRKRLIMKEIAEKIRRVAKIQVNVDDRQGVIRFGNRDLFSSGQWTVSDSSREIMRVIADAIVEVLPCFTMGPDTQFTEYCNPEFAIIDAIQIEGHTDDQPTSRSLRIEYINDNLELSVRRATSTYRTMVEHRPALRKFQNAENPAQPVLSVSGYGEERPIAENNTEVGRELNRRIDLRFIMMTPQSLNEIENFKNRLLFGARSKEIAQ